MLLRARRKRVGERALQLGFFLCGALSLLTTFGIVAVLIFETVEFFAEVSLLEFLTDTQWTPLFAKNHFGILVAMPVGLVCAIYLSEFAPEPVRRMTKPVLEVLAGIPTVVYGYFALLFVTPLLQTFIPSLSGFNALAPG